MIRRIVPFAAVAIVASLLIVVPALGSSHGEDAVRLHLGSDSRSFSYDGVVQTITTSNCRINSAEPLIDLSSSSGTSPGSFANSIGVRGAGGNGTPCSQVESIETLNLRAVTATGSKLAGRVFEKVRLDVEMTKNALVKLTFVGGSQTRTFTLQTGSSITSDQSDDADYDVSEPYVMTSDPLADPDFTDACAAPNSSGPNSGGSDNCLWTVDPGFTFDRISLTTTTGTVSLEGSSDFGNDPAYDSLFFLANAAPTAVNDSATTDEDTSVTVNVLGNDTDADLDTLTVSSVDTTGTLGTVTSNGTGVTYDPNGQFEDLGTGESATDTFGYTIGDGNGGTDTATVTMTITGVNDAPVGIEGDATTDEDTTTTITVATDVDSTVLTASCSTTEGGTWEDNGDGTVDYTPPANFSGTDVLTCTVTDDEGQTTSTQAEITVTVGGVNDDPVAVDDDAYADDEDPSVTIDVLANDTDVDLDTLTVSSVDTTGTLGSVINNGTDVTYSPPTDFTGSDTFGYTVSDGNGGTDTATVTVWELFQCDETLSVSQGTASATYTRLPPSSGCGDAGKPYKVELTSTFDPGEGESVPTVIFEPRPLEGEPVEDCSVIPTPELCTDEFAAVLTFDPRTKTNPPTTGTLQYDPVARDPGEEYDFREMLWCSIPNFDPFAESRPAAADILPAGESWCVASASIGIYSATETLTTWTVYGIGDPGKRG